jgi:hypothetical protein
MGETLPVAVDQYVHFHEKGFLIVRAVVTPDQVRELLVHVDDVLSGEVEARGVAALAATTRRRKPASSTCCGFT